MLCTSLFLHNQKILITTKVIAQIVIYTSEKHTKIAFEPVSYRTKWYCSCTEWSGKAFEQPCPRETLCILSECSLSAVFYYRDIP